MNRLQLFLAKKYLRIKGYSFSEMRKFKFANGTQDDIIVFEHKNPMLIGQAVPGLNVIIVDSRLFTIHSTAFRKFVLEHEYSHKLQSWTNLPLLVFSLLSFGCSAALFCLFLSQLILLFLSRTTIFNETALILLSVLFLLLFSVASWIIEFRADFRAIKYFGTGSLDVFERERSLRPRASVTKKIIRVLTHPPKSFVKWLYEKTH